MPVTDLSGDDWLQSLMAANAFAGQPYGPGAVPGPYSGGPQGLMPGGGVLNRQQMTPGAPSMGYPAMGQPQPPPGPAQGLSLNSNPITRLLAAINPISAANAATGGAPPPAAPSPLLRPGAANSLPLAWGNPTSQDYQNWLSAQLASGSPPAGPTTAPPSPAPYGPPIPPHSINTTNFDPRITPYGPPASSIANAPLPPRRPSSFGGQTPGAGAPQGQPSQTPRPPRSSNRFGTIQYQVPGAGPLSRNPIYTSLNLFGGR